MKKLLALSLAGLALFMCSRPSEKNLEQPSVFTRWTTRAGLWHEDAGRDVGPALREGMPEDQPMEVLGETAAAEPYVGNLAAVDGGAGPREELSGDPLSEDRSVDVSGETAAAEPYAGNPAAVDGGAGPREELSGDPLSEDRSVDVSGETAAAEPYAGNPAAVDGGSGLREGAPGATVAAARPPVDLRGKEGAGEAAGENSSAAAYRATTLDNADVGRALDVLERTASGQSLKSQALNYGTTYLNQRGEGFLAGLIDGGAATLNFRFDKDGKLSGEGDVLAPLFDGPRTTVFGQVGLRSMEGTGLNADTRWIGNFGLGQRWYPYAQELDGRRSDGPLMLGYNLFLDADFTRSHLRGGAGLETQYDWLHLAGNYYFPLSGWKEIGGTPETIFQERPAQGIDLRLKGYVPFYRYVALTGSYGMWLGHRVAGSRTQDPQVWSYGVEYSPIPLLTAYARQEGGQGKDNGADFGLRLTFRGGLSLKDHFSPARVPELTAMTRNAFVSRENRIVTEQRRVDRATGKTEFNLTAEGGPLFELGVRRDGVTFAARDPFDAGGLARNTKLRLTWTGAEKFAEGQQLPDEATTGADGRFTLPVSLTGTNEGIVTLTAAHPDGRTASISLSIENWSVQVQWKDGQSAAFWRGRQASASFQVVKRPVRQNGTLSPEENRGRPAWIGQDVKLIWGGQGRFAQMPPQARTDEKGIFTLDLLGKVAGPITLAVEAVQPELDGRKSDPLPLKVLPGVQVKVLAAPALFKDVPNSAAIDFSLSVEKDDAVILPLSNTKVEVDWGDGFAAPSLGPVATDAQGRFRIAAGRLTARKTGDLSVRMRTPDFQWPEWIDANDQEAMVGETVLSVKNGGLTLALADPGTAFYEGIEALAVFSLRDGENAPLSGKIDLKWKDGDGGVFQGLPASVNSVGGNFALKLTGLRAGARAVLQASAADGRRTPDGLTLEVRSAALGLNLLTADPVDVGFLKEVRFQLVDKDGKSMANRKLALSWGTAGLLEGLPASIDTDDQGVFGLRLKGLVPGETALTAVLSDGRRATSRPVKVEGSDVDLALSSDALFFEGIVHPGSVRFRLSGKYVGNVRGIALSWGTAGIMDGLPATVDADGMGEFSLDRLKGVKIGETTLIATLPDGRVATSKPVKVESARANLSILPESPFFVGITRPSLTRFRLDAAAVGNAKGVALSWGTAGIIDGLPATVDLDEKGEFALSGLKGVKIGETTLIATLPDGRVATSKPVRAESPVVSLTALSSAPFYEGAMRSFPTLFRLGGKATENLEDIVLSWGTAGFLDGLPVKIGSNGKGEIALDKIKGLRIGETTLIAVLPDGRRAISKPLKIEDGRMTLAALSGGPFIGWTHTQWYRLTDALGRTMPNMQGVALEWETPGVVSGLKTTVNLDRFGHVGLALKGETHGQTRMIATLPDGRRAVSGPLRPESGGSNSVMIAVSGQSTGYPPFTVGKDHNVMIYLRGMSSDNLKWQEVVLEWEVEGIIDGLPPGGRAKTNGSGDIVLNLKALKPGETKLWGTLPDGRRSVSTVFEVR